MYVVSKSMILDRFSKSLGKTTPKTQHNVDIIKKVVIFINHRFRIRRKIEQKRLNVIYICSNFSQEPKTTLCKVMVKNNKSYTTSWKLYNQAIFMSHTPPNQIRLDFFSRRCDLLRNMVSGRPHVRKTAPMPLWNAATLCITLRTFK